jgi:hypothetical protein
MERPYLNQEVRRSVAKRADYLLERQLLIDKKKYPSSVAMRRMKD